MMEAFIPPENKIPPEFYYRSYPIQELKEKDNPWDYFGKKLKIEIVMTNSSVMTNISIPLIGSFS